jgi:hypothetical protein
MRTAKEMAVLRARIVQAERELIIAGAMAY